MDSVNVIVPDAWSELSDSMLRFVYRLFACNLSCAEIRTHCFCHWGGIRILSHSDNLFLCKWQKRHLTLSSVDFFCAVEALRWLDKLPPAPVRLDSVKGAVAVDAQFLGVTFEDYLQVDNLYQGFLSTKNDKMLDDIASIVYPGIRMPLAPEERINIFYWVAALKDLFSRNFRHFLQPYSSSQQDSLDGKSQYEILSSAMNAQIRALTKGDITKEREVLQMDTWRALTELDALAREYQETQSNYKT